MPCLSGYRYCGPDCSGPGPPTNKLDSICMEHDACYRKYGSTNTICDQVFLNRLSPYLNLQNELGRDARLMFRAIRLKRLF
ncbi:Parvovirus coat protein VP1-like protein [Aquibacillus saliphilus]|uniref:Parvovirus coat protein VP1-like protein n=1 Tax=Aquibacillus saliphilus TaxID=1909422 RepID=UPI001CF000E7|nr:Parvovirus coat protein VP1-like protein [Aquibacillus saliphilus]